MGKKGKSTGGAKQGSFSSAPIAKPAAANPTTATGSEGKKTESSVERRGKDKASSTQVISSAANSPALSPQDEAAAREIAFFRQSIDDLTTSLSSVSLKEVDLLSKFDAHLSGETSMPEEGIQAARDLYLDVAKFQMKLIAKYDVLKSCQVMLQHENAEMKRKASELVDETSKMLHQKDVLHALADELAKKKEVFLNENQIEKEKELQQRQAISESYMARITELSKQLEDRSSSRIAEARRSDALKDKLRVSLNRYMKEEEEFKRNMKACEDELDRQNNLIPKKGVKKEPAEGDGAPADGNQDGSAASGAAQGTRGEEEDEEDNAFRAEVEEEVRRTNEAKEHIVTLVATEKGLRAQLAEYADRFERFQEALNKSNELFGGFKVRMEELTGVIRSLEKENAVLLEKERKSQELLSAMRAEHSGQLSDISRGEQQITRLQSLIMKLEQDNQALESQLKGVTSETPSDNVTVVQSS